MARPPRASSVDAAAETTRLRSKPPQGLDSKSWHGNREIDTQQTHEGLAYTSGDFRQELARAKRRQHWLTFAGIAIALVMIIVVVAAILHLEFGLI